MITAPANPETLAKAIAEVAVLRGHFTLRSGKTSSYYLDKYLFSTRPDLLKQLAPMFAEKLHVLEARLGIRADRVAGAELGGIPLVTAVSMHTGLPSIFVRNSKKAYGTTKQLEGVIKRGDHVVLIEDIATTGGQALEAVNALRAEGANVFAVIATIDRLEGAKENIEKAELAFEALFTKKDLGVTE